MSSHHPADIAASRIADLLNTLIRRVYKPDEAALYEPIMRSAQADINTLVDLSKKERVPSGEATPATPELPEASK